MQKPSLLFLALLLAGCAPGHLYRGPADGPVAHLQAKATVFENRNGESLRENYNPTGIDGKVLRSNWHVAEIDGQFHLPPGPHKILARASIRRGGIWNNADQYHGVLTATLVDGKHYFLNGTPRFADNLLEMWVEDSDSGAKVSEVLTLDLSKPVQRPNVVSYPIYIPAKH